jgi:putative transposase
VPSFLRFGRQIPVYLFQRSAAKWESARLTYYNWKKKYAGLGVPELRKLRQLEEENQKLKQLVADLSLDKQMLQDVLKKSFKAGSEAGAGRKLNEKLPGCYHACMFSCLLTTFVLPGGRRRTTSHIVVMILLFVVESGKLHRCESVMAIRESTFCLDVKGGVTSAPAPRHKRVYRVYCEEGLNLRSKRPKRSRAASQRLDRPQLSSIHQSWSGHRAAWIL